MIRPKVIVFQVASVDGRVAYTPDVPLLYELEKWRQISGESIWLGVIDWMKSTHQPQVFLEGSGSFVKKDQKRKPLPVVEGDPGFLYQDHLPESIIHHPDLKGWGVVVDSKGRGRNWLTWVDQGIHILILVADQTPPEYLAYLQRKHIPYLVAGSERVNFHQALDKLMSQLRVTCVLSSGGGKLNGALLREGLVDELNLVIYPAIVGGMDTPALFDSPDLTPDDWPSRLKLVSVERLGEGHVWLRYEVDSKAT